LFDFVIGGGVEGDGTRVHWGPRCWDHADVGTHGSGASRLLLLTEWRNHVVLQASWGDAWSRKDYGRF
jgi:hypothetical protein